MFTWHGCFVKTRILNTMPTCAKVDGKICPFNPKQPSFLRGMFWVSATPSLVYSLTKGKGRWGLFHLCSFMCIKMDFLFFIKGRIALEDLRKWKGSRQETTNASSMIPLTIALYHVSPFYWYKANGVSWQAKKQVLTLFKHYPCVCPVSMINHSKTSQLCCITFPHLLI